MNQDTVAVATADVAGNGWLLAWGTGPASRRFVYGALLLAFLASFVVWNIHPLDFLGWVELDGGAALRADELVASGKRAGIDFGYYYGLLPIVVCRAGAALISPGPARMIALTAIGSIVVALSQCALSWRFRPSRLGTLVLAAAVLHTTLVGLPTHVLEALLLSAGVALFANGRRRSALALTALAVFTKVSMGTVLAGGMGILVVCDAIRARSARPLRDLLAPFAALLAGALILGASQGFDSLVAVMDPRAGARVYRASHFGFFTPGGLEFWWPKGHGIGWYVGSIAGIWLVGTLTLFVLGARSALRIARSLRSRATPPSRADEVTFIAALGHFAFVMAFFPSATAYFTVHYYTWLLVMGLAPAIARAGQGARLRNAGRQRAAALGWLALAGLSVLGNRLLVQPKIQELRAPVATINGFTSTPDVAADWDEARRAAHHAGSVAAVGRGAHFSAVDPTIAEGPYWMILPGMDQPVAMKATLDMIARSDAVVVAQTDVALLHADSDVRIASWFDRAKRIVENKTFVVLEGGIR